MGDAQRRARPPVGLRRRPQRPRGPRGAGRRRPGHDRPRRPRHRAASPTARPTGCCASSTCRWRCPGCRTTTSSTPSPARRPPSGSASTATPSSRGCAPSAPTTCSNPGRMNTYSVAGRGRLGHRHRRPRAQRGRARGPARRLRAASSAPVGPGAPRARHRRRPHRRHPRDPRRDGRAARRPRRRRPQGALPARAHRWRTSRPTCASAWPGPASPTSRPTRPSSPACRPCVAAAADGDVCAVMCHAERRGIAAWLRRGRRRLRRPGRHPPQGGRGRAASTRPRTRSPPCGSSTTTPSGSPRGAALHAAHPGDARVAFEYAGDARRRRRRGGRRAALRGGPRRLGCASRCGTGPRSSSPRACGSSAGTRGGSPSSRTSPRRYPDSVGRRGLPRPRRARRRSTRRGRCASCSRTVVATSTDPDVERYRRALTAYAADARTR